MYFKICVTEDYKVTFFCLIIFCYPQIFLKTAEQRDAWIGTQEAYLANENLGVRIIINFVSQTFSETALWIYYPLLYVQWY